MLASPAVLESRRFWPLPRFHDDGRNRCILFIADLLAISVAWHLAIQLRVLFNPLMRLNLTTSELKGLAPPLILILPVWSVLVFWVKLYQRRIKHPISATLIRAIEASLLAGTLIIVQSFFFFDHSPDFSRSFVLLFVLLSFLSISAARLIAGIAVILIEKRWSARERWAIVGPGSKMENVFEDLWSFGWDSDLFTFVGTILSESEPRDYIGVRAPVLGTTSNLAELINRQRLNRIIMVPDGMPPTEVDDCARTSKRMGVVVSRVIGVAEPDARAEVRTISGLRLLDVKPIYFTRREEFIRWSFDIAFASILLLLCAPVLGVCAVLVKLTSSGPILYRSTRVGRGGRHFEFLKFRSMFIDAEQRKAALKAVNEKNGHLFKIKNDLRVTRFGRFMRRFSLDELPQLINVLRGDMSLVGPRPLPAEDLDPDGQSREFVLWAEQRSKRLPGVTGLWQIRGRSSLSFEQMVDFDLEYITHWSLKLDLLILMATPGIVIRGKGAF